MNNKTLVIGAIILLVGLGVVLVGGKFLIAKITSNVIEEFKRSYTPGPYNPGYDPDKISPNTFTNPSPQPQKAIGPPLTPEQWNKMWENERS